MLTSIREKTQGIIAGFIVLLIAIPFALWGINSYFEGGSTIAVAKVDGVDITQRAYRRTLDQLRNQVRAGTLDDPQFKQLVVQNLIDEALQAEQTSGQGYRISDARLAQTIREAPTFQRDGRFDPQIYEGLLRREGQSTLDFEERLRRDYVTQQVRKGFIESVIVTDTEIAEVLRLQRQQREIAYAVIGLDFLTAKIHPSKKEIEDYYASHARDYSSKEQVRIEYLTLAAADLVQGYQPSDDELRQVYAAEIGRYTTPGERRASHILVALGDSATPKENEQALKKIQDIEVKLKQGADFSRLAKEHSDDPDTAVKGGDLGKITRGLLPKELETVVFNLKRDEISTPIRTEFGYHLVQLSQLKPEKRQDFNDVRTELVKLARKRRGEERYYESTEKFQNLIYEHPDTLAPAAKALDLKIERSDWFGRDGGQGIVANPKVLEAAFSPELLNDRRNSNGIELDVETLVSIRVIDHRPATVMPLDQVQTRVAASLKQEQAITQAQDMTRELLKQMREGTPLAEVAKKQNLEYHKPQTVTRHGASMDRRVLEAAFRSQRAETGKSVYGAVDLPRRGMAIFAVTRVQQGANEKPGTPEWENVRRQLVSRRGADYYANYRAGLRKNAEIKIFPDQL